MSKETMTKEKNIPETDNSSKEGKIGTMLHDVRSKKKLSIEEISQALRIKAAYLDAIEKSDYQNIPEPPYGIGFIRSYAAFLGLNSERIVQIFKEETKQETAPEAVSVNNAPVSSADNNEDIYLPNYKYILVGLVILLVAYFGWNAVSVETEEEDKTVELTVIEEKDTEYQDQQEAEETNPEEVMENITITEASFEPSLPTEEKTSEPQVEEKTEQTPPSEATPKKTGRVVLKVKKDTWIEVKDEDKLWISKVLHAGDEYVLPQNGEGKTVSFGNTDGVDVVIDGKIVTIVSNTKKTNIKMDAFLGNH